MERRFKKCVSGVLGSLGLRALHLEIVLLGGHGMLDLKQRFMRHKRASRRGGKGRYEQKAVDVLAFAEPEGFPHPEDKLKVRHLGEIYLNKNLVLKSYGKLVKLFIHGLLHLLGYTHDRDQDAYLMESIEKELWHHVSSLA